jgi:hypothetical protein
MPRIGSRSLADYPSPVVRIGPQVAYDPKKGLKTIVVAEAAEKAAMRAVRADPDDPIGAQAAAETLSKFRLRSDRHRPPFSSAS